MRQGSAETGLVMVALRWGPPKSLLVGGFQAVLGSLGPHVHVLSQGGCSPQLCSLSCSMSCCHGDAGIQPLWHAGIDWVAGNQGYPCHALGRGSPPMSPPSHAAAAPGIPTASLQGCGVGTTWGLFGAKAWCQGAGCGLGARGNSGAVVRSCSISQVETCQGCHVINTQ